MSMKIRIALHVLAVIAAAIVLGVLAFHAINSQMAATNEILCQLTDCYGR